MEYTVFVPLKIKIDVPDVEEGLVPYALAVANAVLIPREMDVDGKVFKLIEFEVDAPFIDWQYEGDREGKPFEEEEDVS